MRRGIDTSKPNEEATMAAEYSAQADGIKTSARKAATEGISDLREGVREYMARGKERLVELEEGLEGQVQEHPIRSILIAAGVGVLVGALIARR
jgi:ElaB/YqjD/DUF883 family membrane-anchored ribosome-binding protein